MANPWSIMKNRVAIPTGCWFTAEKSPVDYPRITGLEFLFPDRGNTQLGETEEDEREELSDHFIVRSRAMEAVTGTISRRGLVQQLMQKVPNLKHLLRE